MSKPRVEHWGDEGELHVALAWCRKSVVLESTEDYIKAEGPFDTDELDDLMRRVKPEYVRYGWAIVVPSADEVKGHPLHRGYYDDGSIILGPLFRPPFLLHHDGRRLFVLLPRPATWLRDH